MLTEKEMELSPLFRDISYEEYRRMMDCFHQGMVFQVINHFQWIFHMAFNPEGQGFQPLEEHESVEGGEGCACVP